MIKTISFLVNETRVFLNPGFDGKFKMPQIVSKVSLNAKDSVTHPILSECDPVITTTSGEKLRVYQGGDSKQLVVTTISIIEEYDKKMREKHEKRFESKKIDLYDTDSGFPWDEYYGS